MKHIKLFEQFDEEESWWDEESPFDAIKLLPKLKIISTGSINYYIAEMVDKDHLKTYNDIDNIYETRIFNMNPRYSEDTLIHVFSRDMGPSQIMFKDLPKEIKNRII